MPLFRATSPQGDATEYQAAHPEAVHLTAGWKLEELVTVEPAPDAPDPGPQPMYGGRRRLSKLEFIELMGDAAYVTILQLAKASIEVEAWVKKMELTTADSDGTSIDLDDPRTQAGVASIGTVLLGMGVVPADWAEGVLNG